MRNEETGTHGWVRYPGGEKILACGAPYFEEPAGREVPIPTALLIPGPDPDPVQCTGPIAPLALPVLNSSINGSALSSRTPLSR
jgi:hypothetical protein